MNQKNKLLYFELTLQSGILPLKRKTYGLEHKKMQKNTKPTNKCNISNCNRSNNNNTNNNCDNNRSSNNNSNNKLR